MFNTGPKIHLTHAANITHREAETENVCETLPVFALLSTNERQIWGPPIFSRQQEPGQPWGSGV